MFYWIQRTKSTEYMLNYPCSSVLGLANGYVTMLLCYALGTQRIPHVKISHKHVSTRARVYMYTFILCTSIYLFNNLSRLQCIIRANRAGRKHVQNVKRYQGWSILSVWKASTASPNLLWIYLYFDVCSKCVSLDISLALSTRNWSQTLLVGNERNSFDPMICSWG